MKIKNVYYSGHFKSQLKKYPQRQQRIIEQKLKLFIENPFEPSLKTHKLTGKLKDYWAFTVSYKQRILFEFVDDESVGLIDIGSHDIYK